MKLHSFLLLMLIPVAATPLAFALAAQATPSSVESHNWSGYEASGSGFTAITGSWVVPNIAVDKTKAGDATWVGIGGMESTDLIQTGTRALVENGSVSYEAWYELYPAPAHSMSMIVHQGDHMSASLCEISANQWRITLLDSTTDQEFEATLAYTSSGNSAEWIEEAPESASGNLLPLDDFAPVTFSAAYAIENGSEESPAALHATKLSLVDSSSLALLAAPSSLMSTGASFLVTRS